MADEQKPGATVAPEDATREGWWGTSPVHKDRADFTVAVQGPIAEEAAQGGAAAKPTGAGEVDKTTTEQKQAASRRAATKGTD